MNKEVARTKLLEIMKDDYDPEAVMQGLSLIIKNELVTYSNNPNKHPMVIKLLENIIEGLDQLAFDYYASTK